MQDNYGETVLMMASYEVDLSTCKLLIEKDADINIKNNNGRTAIDIMKSEGIYQKLQPIIKRTESIKYFKKVFKEYTDSYMDIFNTTLYSQELELDDIKANIKMFYSNVVARLADNTINENVEL